MRTLAERLRYAMEILPSKKVKGVDLAQAVGVKPPSVSDWLSGKSKTMEGENLLKAAKFLNVDPVWLATGKGNPSSSPNTTNKITLSEQKMISNDFLYVPILQTKQNEYAALSELKDNVKSFVKPLFNLTNSGKERRAQGLPKQIADRWGNLPCYLDLNTNRDFIIDSSYYIDWVLNKLYHQGLNNIDLVVTFGSSLATLNSIKAAIQNYGFGLAIRVYVTEIDPNANKKINDFINFFELSNNDVDLIIDYSEYVQLNSFLHQNAIEQVLGIITSSSEFRNIIIAGSSMPKELPRNDYNPHGFVPRIEWQAFKNIYNQTGIMPYIFADYASVHPEEFESDIPVKPNAKIKYTLDEEYMLVVRFQAHVHADGFEQYYDMAEHIINSGYYYGANFSSGDKYIDDCAKRLVGTGNFGTWVKVGVNHHITVVVDQIANLYGISILV